MEVLAFETLGLGDASYLVVLGDDAVVVDPQRDAEHLLAAAEERGATVRAVLETHVHNDYVSGAPALAAATGADLVLPAGAGAAFRFRPAFHGEDLAVGGLTIRPLHTPGHTPEHISYLASTDDGPVCVFSGGSLLVGSAGRTDLLGAERAESLARLQHGSLARLATLPDGVALYPTHGSGSFCSVSATGGASSTIGRERATNPLLGIADAGDFARTQLDGLQPYPAYYRHMAPLNLAGQPAPPRGPVPVLDPAQVAGLVAAGAAVVDGRERRVVAAGRIPGSWAIELRDSFATWVGWLVPFATPLVLVLDDDDQLAEARTALARVGFTDLAGVLHGVERWADEGRPLSSYPVVDVDAVPFPGGDGPLVLDVRSPAEWSASHVDGSVHGYLPDLAVAVPPELNRDRPVHVVCESGARAATAAAILADVGYHPVLVTGGGVAELSRRLFAPAGPVR